MKRQQMITILNNFQSVSLIGECEGLVLNKKPAGNVTIEALTGQFEFKNTATAIQWLDNYLVQRDLSFATLTILEGIRVGYEATA